MTPSELAFLALGLILGIATGGAIAVVIRSRPPTHVVRVTVARDAIPRRASTLAADVLRAAAGPTPGGPGDHRLVERETDPADLDERTIVRSRRPIVASPALPWPFTGGPTAMDAGSVSGRHAVAIRPEPDPVLAALGMADARALGSGRVDGTADEDVAGADGVASDPTREEPPPGFPELLAGDRRAMVELVAAVAGPDQGQRLAWDALLTSFVDTVRARALELGFIDLPMGNPFWDTFTIDECRAVTLALASTGRRFDGLSGWADGLVPAYRDLSRALAESGIDPKRIRAWPNSQEIAELFRGASIAATEAVGQWAPDLSASELRTFLGDRDRGFDELWLVWDAVRAAIVLEAVAA